METKQRTIGLLGGMSWESTAEYYRLANVEVAKRLGGLHSARLVLSSVDFADIEQLQATARWTEAGQLLAREAKGLEAAGAELLLLCTNTMHKVADQVQAAITVPLLHIADAAAGAIKRTGLSVVGLLGTAFTMEQDFYRDRLSVHGLRVLTPEAADRAGIVRDGSRDLFRRVIHDLVDHGGEGIVLGCTEIELLIGAPDSPVPVFPTTRLHVEAAVDISLDAPAPKP
jgi:aspartate racemase